MTTSPVTASVRVFSIDPSHSRLGFAVRHLGLSKVRGNFEQFEGAVHLDPADLSSLETHAEVQAASITTHDAQRDAHLRSADFFDVEQHPTLSFKSAGAGAVRGNRFTLRGDLTMHGVTRPVELEAEFMGEQTDPWGGRRIAFEAHTRVNRRDFGLTWGVVLEAGGLLVADEVDITLEIEAVQQDA